MAAPNAERLHIGFFGKRNSGKSSIINAFAGQEVSIVSDVAGTTTDPVYKPMEISPLGACVIIDTAGFDDAGGLGASRVEKTMLALDKTDIAVLIISQSGIKEELDFFRLLKKRGTPALLIVNKTDALENAALIAGEIKKETGETPLLISAKTGGGVGEIKDALARLIPENHGDMFITGGLAGEGDSVLLVMPQDIQAPKGRLILPQAQTLRELLDKKCVVTCVTTDKLTAALAGMTAPPKLIITDSQVFRFVYDNKPKESLLTSFSVLFAAYKGDLPYYTESVRAIESLTEASKVLIAECCSHAPLSEDIGRVKIPGMLRQRIGAGLTVDIAGGTDFPSDPSDYDLIIQCGACMFNRKYVLSRIERSKNAGVPMTNYGVVIAHLSGILEHVAVP